MSTKIGKHVPDKLDQFCNRIFDILQEYNKDPIEQKKLLEQCIDYCEMAIYDLKENH